MKCSDGIYNLNLQLCDVHSHVKENCMNTVFVMHANYGTYLDHMTDHTVGL